MPRTRPEDDQDAGSPTWGRSSEFHSRATDSVGSLLSPLWAEIKDVVAFKTERSSHLPRPAVGPSSRVHGLYFFIGCGEQASVAAQCPPGRFYPSAILGLLEDHVRLAQQDAALRTGDGLFRDDRQGVEEPDDHGGHPSCRLADLVEARLTIFAYDGSDTMSRTRPKLSR